MKGHFATYLMAELAMDKGFDCSCIAWFDPKTKEFNMLGQENEPYGYIHTTGCVKEIVQAPMYFQIVDWLLEKHKIYIHIEPFAKDFKQHWRYDLIRIEIKEFMNPYKHGYNPFITTHNLLYDTHFYAMQSAILESLNLLPNV